MMERKLRIGWYLSEKKRKQLQWQDFEERARSKNLDVVMLDLTNSPESLGKFDILTFKLTDELVKTDDMVARTIVTNAKELVRLNPQAVVIDPIDGQELTIDRSSMHDILAQLTKRAQDIGVRCPESGFVHTSEDIDKLPPMEFPLIVKSLQASGSLAAHEMGLIWRKSDLAQFSFPVYIQEFLNHNATIFKVYVIGNESHIVVRKSLPNFERGERDPVIFNSQHWKHELPPEFTVDYAGKYPIPPMDVINTMTAHLSSLLGLTLFGYDVITDVSTGKQAVIDVNYFPDFSGVDNVCDKVLDHLVATYHKRTSGQK